MLGSSSSSSSSNSSLNGGDDFHDGGRRDPPSRRLGNALGGRSAAALASNRSGQPNIDHSSIGCQPISKSTRAVSFDTVKPAQGGSVPPGHQAVYRRQQTQVNQSSSQRLKNASSSVDANHTSQQQYQSVTLNSSEPANDSQLASERLSITSIGSSNLSTDSSSHTPTKSASNPRHQHASNRGRGYQPTSRVTDSPSASSTASSSARHRDRRHHLAKQSSTSVKDPAALELERVEREEAERRQLLQLYVFVARCIAYPFYSKPPTDLVRRYLKVSKQQLGQLKERFAAFLNGDLDVVGDEAFTNAVQSYNEVFLCSDRVASMVRGGGCSMHDFREVFRLNAEHRVRCLPQIEGLNKSNVVSAWMVKFDQICRGGTAPSMAWQKLQMPQPELVMTKEQLYDLFQSTLGVKKYEHQILFNALQLDNADEQAAQVRRELDGQLVAAEDIARTRSMPRLVVKDMESLYVEELKKMVGELMLRLEAVPVAKGSTGFQKFRQKSRPTSGNNPPGGGNSSSGGVQRQISVQSSEDVSTSDFTLRSKSDIQLQFSMEIVVGQVKNLKSVPSNKMVYCTMQVEGCEKLQTDLAEAGKPTWGTQGDFTTNQPLPTVKVKLYAETSGLLSLESGKELGRVVLHPTCIGSRQAEWHQMQTGKQASPDDLRIQLVVRMEKPNNLKHCGFLYALGRTSFRKWKRRYTCLIQVSQYTFIMASYRERKSDPNEIMQLEGFTVDYCDPQSDLTSIGGKFFFNLVKEGDTVLFATDDDTSEYQLWVQAIYRATGQTHKPILPTSKSIASSSLDRGIGSLDGASTSVALTSSSGISSKVAKSQDADRLRKHGLDEFVSVEAWRVDHASLFRLLQARTLEQRMKDAYVCLGWFSPSQMFLLDEYCARYGVRGCLRHLYYLNDLLDRAEKGTMIDPALVHYSYAFCCCNVFGNDQDMSIRTVLYEERQMFIDIRTRLYALLEKQITEFRYYFPFGRPEGALKLTLGLLERVLMKDNGAPASTEDVREVIRRCLEQAALVNYTRISEYAAIESGRDNNAQLQQHRLQSRTLVDLIHLGELCIEVLRQNEEHHAEAFAWFHDLLVEHTELFWSFFATDMNSVLETMPPDCWDGFPLFQLLNDYFLSEDSLRCGKFHLLLTETFTPLVLRYVDLMEASINQSVGGGEIGQSSTPGQQQPAPGDQQKPPPSSTSPGGFAVLGAASALTSALSSAAAAVSSGQASPSGLLQQPGQPTTLQPVTSTELLWKLEALQTFIRELHWPDVTFAEDLDNRLKLMAAYMIDAAAQRNVACFEAWLKRCSRGTDFILPNECCSMINTVAELKSNILKLCTKDTKGEDMHQYHNQTETNLERIQRKMAILLNDKLGSILEAHLVKLARYDVNTLLSSVLSLAKPTDEGGKTYIEFLRVNLEQMRQKVTDELYILSVMETWYTTQMRTINEWLVERKANGLSPYQFTCLSNIVKKMHADFELQGISHEALDIMAYQTITQRLQMEETTLAIRQGDSSTSSPVSQAKSILGSITDGLSNISSGFPKPGFLSKI